MLTKPQLKDLNRITTAMPIGTNDGSTTIYHFDYRGHSIWIETTNKRVRKDLNFFLYIDEFDCGTAFRYISELFHELKTLKHA